MSEDAPTPNDHDEAEPRKPRRGDWPEIPVPPAFPEVPDHPDARREKQRASSSFREYVKYSGVGAQFLGTMAVGVLAGYFADDAWGTTPWFLLLGILAGLSLALWQVAKDVMKP